MENQSIDTRKNYHKNYVKLNSNACEATATNHWNNLQPSAKDNETNQIKTNSEKSSDKSNLSKKSNQSIPGRKDHALSLATQCWKVLLSERCRANV